VSNLMSEEQARRMGDEILRLVSADDAVLHIHDVRSTVSRFSNNAIAQNSSEDRCRLSLTVAFDGRKGTATVDAAEPETLRALVARAEEIAKVAPPDPEFLPSLGPQSYPAVAAWSERTAAIGPEECAAMVLGVTGPARKAEMRASGTLEIELSADCVMTSNGAFGYHRATEARAGCTIMGADSSGWKRDFAVDVSQLRMEELAGTAIEQARRAASPREIPPGRYTAVLMPAAAGHMAMPLIWWANARLTLEGLTYLSDRRGKKIASDEITICSDPADPLIPSAPFDEEGVPQRTVRWVDHGVIGEMWWDRWTAQLHGGTPGRPSGAARMEGSGRKLDELIAGVERGVLISHFWYIRPVKADETLVTGMTRDATFWIEDGRISHGLKNMRFNESALGMLQRTVALGTPEVCLGPELPPSRFPALVVNDWNFVGVSSID
jgi:predicted Zn-dependent protease